MTFAEKYIARCIEKRELTRMRIKNIHEWYEGKFLFAKQILSIIRKFYLKIHNKLYWIFAICTIAAYTFIQSSSIEKLDYNVLPELYDIKFYVEFIFIILCMTFPIYLYNLYDNHKKQKKIKLHNNLPPVMHTSFAAILINYLGKRLNLFSNKYLTFSVCSHIFLYYLLVSISALAIPVFIYTVYYAEKSTTYFDILVLCIVFAVFFISEILFFAIDSCLFSDKLKSKQNEKGIYNNRQLVLTAGCVWFFAFICALLFHALWRALV